MASTVSGEIVDVGDIIDLEHWVDQLVSPVLFTTAFSLTMDNHKPKNENVKVVVEVGPKPILSKLAQELSSPKEDKSQDKLLWETCLGDEDK